MRVTNLLDVDGLSEDAVMVLLLQLAENGSEQDAEGGQLGLQHRLLQLHLDRSHGSVSLIIRHVHTNEGSC